MVPGGLITQRADGTRTPLPHEVEEHIALNAWHEWLISHYADRGEVTIDVHREVLALHTLDGRVFDPPLHSHVTTAEMRRQTYAAKDPEATWSSLVDQIDRLAAVVDSGQVELVLTEVGVLRRRL